MDLKGQTAVVTGGSRGIGKAICLRLASEGADLVINYTSNEAAALEVAKECQAYGVKTLCVKANVANVEECDAMFDAVLELNGRIDILVNNAGITRDNLMLKMKHEDFDAVVDINLKGAFNCMKKVTRTMMKQRYGRIINMSSIVGLRGNAGQVNYAATKAGIIGMTKSLSKELASRGVTVNAIAPGCVDTDMTRAIGEAAHEAILASIPMGRAADPADIANAVAFFADPRSGYVTGQVLSVDGGMAV